MSPGAHSPAGDDAASPDYSDHDRDGMNDHDDGKHGHSGSSDASPSHHTSGDKAKGGAKDPLRPRRKKARRACYACQRAHLTCGDERPCQRCIKRGLQDACQDGIRKKAKYLHDAPNEALMPGVGNLYRQINGSQTAAAAAAAAAQQQLQTEAAQSMAQASAFFPTPQTPTYDVYGPQEANAGSSAQMPPPPLHSGSFSAQTTPISPHFGGGNGSASGPQQSTGLSTQAGQATLPQMQQFGNPLFDPSDPAIFNFDLASLNFANNYGALEFGMLGHMSSGAADTPPENSLLGQLNQGGFTGPHSMSSYSDMFGQDRVISADWPPTPHARQGSAGQLLHTPQSATTPNPLEMGHGGRHESLGNQPHAYAIGAGPSSLASASPASMDHNHPAFEGGPMSPAMFSQQQQQQQQQQQEQQYSRTSHAAHFAAVNAPSVKSAITLNTLGTHSAIFRKRRRNTSVYSSITQPYPYTAHFHSLTAFLQSRFTATKKMRIAKALASIRPSFISVTGTLNRDDLIFMEQSFQRALEEYEDFITAVGCPSIICRRTGEVAAVSKEFCILTGWTRNILLGKDTNLNINTGRKPGDDDESGSTSRSGGANSSNNGTSNGTSNPNTNDNPNAQQQPSATTDAADKDDPARGGQPVFIAELLDEDSVVHFYEDFARLAFSDSHGRAQRSCKLLKYRTKEDLQRLDEAAGKLGTNGHHSSQKGVNGSASASAGSGSGGAGSGTKGLHSARIDHTIAGEASFNALGGKEGKVDCMMCWSVKRDLFEVPMMIVLNFLPCI